MTNGLAVSVFVLFGTGACKDPGSRPDAVGSMGGLGGVVGMGGAAGVGGAAGAVSTGGVAGAGDTAGTGGASVGGAGGEDPMDAGDDGPAVVPDATDARVLQPIQIVEGLMDAAVYNDLRFVGVGLDQYEGDVVTLRIGSSTGTWRRASAQVRIVQGAFDVLFPQVVAPIYEQKIAHIDDDGNGRCDAGEPLFIDGGLVDRDSTLTFTPGATQVRVATAGQCDVQVNSSF